MDNNPIYFYKFLLYNIIKKEGDINSSFQANLKEVFIMGNDNLMYVPASQGTANTGIGLGSAGLATGILGALGAVGAYMSSKNRVGEGAAIAATANHACNKTCVSRDAFDLYREGCQNSKESIINFASLADRQAQQFAGIGTLIWEDRLAQASYQKSTELALAKIAADAECCCKLLNQRMDSDAMRQGYENQITRMMMAQGFSEIACKLPRTTPFYDPVPWCTTPPLATATAAR